eukprot:7390814-Prymnesium_polylepis.1
MEGTRHPLPPACRPALRIPHSQLQVLCCSRYCPPCEVSHGTDGSCTNHTQLINHRAIALHYASGSRTRIVTVRVCARQAGTGTGAGQSPERGQGMPERSLISNGIVSVEEPIGEPTTTG